MSGLGGLLSVSLLTSQVGGGWGWGPHSMTGLGGGGGGGNIIPGCFLVSIGMVMGM